MCEKNRKLRSFLAPTCSRSIVHRLPCRSLTVEDVDMRMPQHDQFEQRSPPTYRHESSSRSARGGGRSRGGGGRGATRNANHHPIGGTRGARFDDARHERSCSTSPRDQASAACSPPQLAAAAAPPPSHALTMREKRRNNEYESPLARDESFLSFVICIASTRSDRIG